MNLDLKNWFQWLKANKLSLNVMKTQLIIFQSSSKKTDHSLKFKLDGKKIVIFDDHLLWPKQINHVATTINQATSILSKLRSRASLKILKMTYLPFSFLFPPVVWLSTLGLIKYNQPKQNTETSKQSLEKILFEKKQDSISQVYKELKTLKFPDLLYLQNCLFTSQIKTNQRLANSFVDLRHWDDKHNCLK